MPAFQTQQVLKVYACSFNGDRISCSNGGDLSRPVFRIPMLMHPVSSLFSKFDQRFLGIPVPLRPDCDQAWQFFCQASGDGGAGNNDNRGGSGGDDGGSESSGDGGESGDGIGFGILGALLSGWRSRVAADPQFPFKVLMEEVVGVSACVIGDMASRPNFGLNELDFVFSTLVVGCILNFALMYLLAPTLASSTPTLPFFFSSCPPSHMFEPGGYSLASRLGTFVYKGAIFAAVGFGAGLVGTAMSNGLIAMRKRMDPSFETPNKPPPTLLNALTWAAHMGVSSNLRYQTLNGIEFMLAKILSPVAFKTSVLALRSMNNVLGGMSFVVLARITGSQSVAEATHSPKVAETEKLLRGEEDDEQSSFK